MDNLELKSWLELWKDEKEKLLEIKGAFIKKEKERELLNNLFTVLQEKEKSMKSDVLTNMYFSQKIQVELLENAKQLGELDKSVQLKRADIIYIQEKMKIIEEKVGKELIDNEKINLLKAIT